MRRRILAMCGPDGDRPKRGILIALLVLIGPIAGFALPDALVSEEAEAAPNPIPILSLSLFPSQLRATVTQSQLGAVTFSGNATVEKMPYLERITVTLQAVVNTGWPVVISPQTMAFVQSGTQRFQVTVIVPPATSSLISGNVIVTGSAKATGLAPIVSSASGVVTVSQYYKLRIEAEAPLREVKPGEITFNVVNVYNDGNGLDTFELSISNNKELVERQWTVLLSSTDVGVAQDEYVPVKITAQSPQKWTLYKKEIETITIEVTSAEGRTRNVLYTKTYPIFIYLKGTYIPGFDPFLAILAITFALVVFKGARDRNGRPVHLPEGHWEPETRGVANT
jgi:hypothetical protein